MEVDERIEMECDKLHIFWLRKNRILRLKHQEEIEMWKETQAILIDKVKQLDKQLED